MKRRKKAVPSMTIPNEEFFAELEAGALTRESGRPTKPVAAVSVDVKTLSEDIARMIANRLSSG